MNDKTYQLTKYPLGSIREIFAIAWPLMLSLLASSVMMFADRLFLGNYSLDAMGASATAGTGAYMIAVLPLVIASISGVFVGQFHGI